MKKFSIVCMVIAYLNCYLGCISHTRRYKPDTSTNDPALEITTSDGRNINFEPQMYRFKNDTLDGVGTEITGDEVTESRRMKIALDDITSVEAGESSQAKIVLLVVGIIFTGVLLYFLWAGTEKTVEEGYGSALNSI